jgi:hypothetical protein
MPSPGWKVEQPPVAEMKSPVKCRHCRGIYDQVRVLVTARYADCSVWIAPCCGHPGVDDRPGERERHYMALDRDEVLWLADGLMAGMMYDALGLRYRKRR